MNASLRRQIYENMDLRETEELLELWQTNDRIDWSDEAFEVIGEILRRRGVEPPAQNEPVLEHKDEPELDPEDLTELELKIIDDDNPPDFYDPLQVINFGKWLNAAAIASVVLAVFSGLIEYPTTQSIVQSFFFGVSSAKWAITIFTLIALILGIGLQFLMTYFPLKVLAHILRILMQMEFNSRKSDALAQPESDN